MTFLGDFPFINITAYESLAGLYFLVALESIDIILIQTEEVFKAGDQSEYKVDKQIYPFE